MRSDKCPLGVAVLVNSVREPIMAEDHTGEHVRARGRRVVTSMLMSPPSEAL